MLSVGQRGGGGDPGRYRLVKSGHEVGGLGIWDGGDRRDELAGALGDEGRTEAKQLVTGRDDGPSDVTRCEHDQLRCPVQPFQVVDGQRAIGELE